ncbi:MAG: heme o synthase [Alicyclobacillus sp.]|nr:heme o synthase [Alicyclobacillus sp.]
MTVTHSGSGDRQWPGTGTLRPADFRSTVRSFVVLTKPKIQGLLLFTAFCAMLLADRGLPNVRVLVCTLVGLGLSGAGSAAINMWYDRDIDSVMSRTADRPIPNGEVAPMAALVYGMGLVVVSFAWLLVTVNWLAAVTTLAGAFYYAVIYTMWLKRRTPQNIVIGGGAGAFPPLVGWAGATGHLSLAAWLMFAIIFLWTPPHFWALALYKNEDYTRAGIPMMPVVRGERSTKIQSLLYAVALALVAVGFARVSHLGWKYTLVAVVANLVFLAFNVRLCFERDGQLRWAKRTFLASVIYLPILFVAMVF